ncbi:hypothetical protein ACP70R_044665 [Stipagrostis hirtigluma subsp. patula]
MMLVAAATIGVALAVALQFAVSSTAAAASAAAAPAMGLQPHCNTRCGDVEVPYPFGITPGCSYPAPGFNLTFDRTRRPPQLLLGDGTLRVVEISIRNSTVRVLQPGGVNISHGSVGPSVWPGRGFGDDGPFVLSRSFNELVLTGCNVQATLHGDNGSFVSGCSSFCSGSWDAGGIIAVHNNSGGKYCSGIGCCQAPIPMVKRRTSFVVRVKWLDEDASMHDLVPVYVFVAEDDWFDREEVGRDMLLQSGSRRRRGHDHAVVVPAVLGWAIRSSEVARAPSRNGTLEQRDCDAEAARSICKSVHSLCRDTGRGYTCKCASGYHGNPYLAYGCQDINECDNKEHYMCFGECTNTIGNFTCQCPRGTHGNHTLLNGCVGSNTGLIIGVSVVSGPAFLLLVLLAFLIHRKIIQSKAKRLKKKFFKQNRGQLLQQLVSHRTDIAERMIIPIEELEKATNNFDQSRKLGGGGHGTVYKGILSDLHVVAIKKPKIVVQREIKEFINEVAILSQINHRNVVKLLGCCLETEVPLLVYEFVSNGTLQHHLHKEATTRSLSWRDRLRIANETAKAIAYLHCSVSIPIVHRDIKSANILLDDALTAKVSDFGASRYIPIDQTGGTTAVQGTPGYLDPMYCSTGLMTEMSDVYSFGVILLEMLTRKIPNSYRSPKGDGLVVHFNALLVEGNLVQILDPQVLDEGGSEVEEVVALAASCIKFKGEERPTMRQVEMALEAFQAPMERVLDDALVGNTEASSLLTRRRTNTEEVSRQYSQEEEFMMSARYPR